MVTIINKDQKKEELAKEIFKLRNKGLTYKEIGDKIGKTKEYVRLVLNYKLLKYESEKLNLEVDKKSVYLDKIGITPELMNSIQQLAEYGVTKKEILEKLKIDNVTFKRFFSKTYYDFFKEYGIDTRELKKKLSKNSRKLNKFDIENIFALYNKGANQKEISELYGLNQTQVSSILQGLQYKEEIKEFNLRVNKENHRKHRKTKSKGLAFKEDDIINIFKLNNEDKDNEYIADIYNVSHLTINKLLKKKLNHYNDIIEKHNLVKKHSVEREKNNQRRKLSEDQIIEIFRLRNESLLSFKEIGDKVGVGIGTISAILNKKIYLNIIEKYNLKIDSSIINKRNIGNRNNKVGRKVNEDQVIEIFRLRNEENCTYKELSNTFKIGKNTIQKILNGERYKDIIEKHNLKRLK